MCGGAVRSAISKSCNLSEDSIVVSKSDGTVTVPKDSGLDKEKVAAALEGTKYKVQ